MGGQLQGEGLGEADDGELGRAVGGEAGCAPFAGHGREGDDAPAFTLRDHGPGDGAAAEERAAHVDPLHVIPDGDVEVDDGPAVGAGDMGGAVDEDVEPAELSDRLAHQAVHLRGVSDVGQDAGGAPAEGLDARDDAGQAGPVGRQAGVGALDEVGDGDVGAEFCQTHGDGAADAVLAGGAGDEGCMSVEAGHGCRLLGPH